MRAMMALLLTALWLNHPSLALAQSPPALVVTLRDSDGHGVAGATMLARDRSGQQILGEAQTDADGRATIERVPVAEVRVAVRGTAGGMSLVQPGDDVLGILVFLDAPTVTVDLLIEEGGVVVPDPLMFALEQAPGSATALPTAPLATTSMAPVGVTAPTPVASVAMGEGSAVAHSSSAPDGGGWLLGPLLILGILAAIVLVLVHQRRAA
jgi:hypothetical protein